MCAQHDGILNVVLEGVLQIQYKESSQIMVDIGNVSFFMQQTLGLE